MVDTVTPPHQLPSGFHTAGSSIPSQAATADFAYFGTEHSVTATAAAGARDGIGGADDPGPPGAPDRSEVWSALRRRWTVPAALTVIVLVAAILRLAGIWNPGFNSDEAVYAGQGAAMVGEEPFDQLFSLFRAHPLLLQLSVGTLFKLVGVSDIAARLLVAGVFGIGAVALTYLLAAELHSRKIGLIAAALLATLPYHVVVTRQVLVDVPMAFFTVLALWLLIVGIRRESQTVMLLAALSAALAALSKEVAVLLVIVAGLYLLLTGTWRALRPSTVVLGGALYALLLAPFPISRLIGPAANASSFVLWQFARPPNHSQDYFVRILLQFAGFAFLALALIGLVTMVARREREDVLVLVWLAVFMGFFQLWPTKLFFYLVVVVPGLAIAAAIGAVTLVRGLGRMVRALATPAAATAALAVIVIAVATLGTVVSWRTTASASAQPEGLGDFDIEVQSFVGAREFGTWAGDHSPEGTRFLTMGPSIGNILRFYGHRESYALSISPDPKRRNPAYVPIPNPDLAIRQMAVHYLVWDAYTADRSPFYASRLLTLADKFGSSVVYSVSVEDGAIVERAGPAPPGADVRVVVYDAPGANPLPSGSGSPS